MAEQLVITLAGMVWWLDGWRNDSRTTASRIRLFRNNYVPTRFSPIGDFTEANFTGYASVSYSTSSAAVINANNVAQSNRFAVATFTCTGGSPQDIYGWYITDNATVFAAAALRFDPAPVNIFTGQSIIINPIMTFGTLYG